MLIAIIIGRHLFGCDAFAIELVQFKSTIESVIVQLFNCPLVIIPLIALSIGRANLGTLSWTILDRFRPQNEPLRGQWLNELGFLSMSAEC